MRLLILAIMTSIAVLLPTSPRMASAATCRFVLGFARLQAAMPATGDCLANEYYNPQNGDALQETTNGLLVWRKADNVVAFTDGYRSWLDGPYGIQARLNSERFAWEIAGTSTLSPPSYASQLYTWPSYASQFYMPPSYTAQLYMPPSYTAQLYMPPSYTAQLYTSHFNTWPWR